MMKLSTMWQVVSTVGEDWTLPVAEEVLQPWGFDPGTVYYFRASANFVCVFRREGRRAFLRFSEASQRPLEGLEAEARLVAWLSGQGIKVAAPVPSRNDRFVETLETSLGRFHAVVFEGLEGDHLETDDCQEADFRAWGAALGRLHAAMQHYTDPSAANRPTWRDHLQASLPAIEGDEALLTEWHELARWAESLPTAPADFGLIHFDFESDNLCWHNGSAGILDFDDSAHYWYAADIAFALRDLFKAGADLAHPSVQAFVAGYRTEHPLNEDLLAQLPMFLRLHGMYTYGRLSRALDLPPGQDCPEWLRRLEAKLQGVRESYRRGLTRTSR